MKHMSLFDPRRLLECNSELFEDEPPEHIPASPDRQDDAHIRGLHAGDEHTNPHSSRAREEFETEAAKDAIENAHLVGAGNDDGPDIDFDPPHNPETCREPACDCYPF